MTEVLKKCQLPSPPLLFRNKLQFITIDTEFYPKSFCIIHLHLWRITVSRLFFWKIQWQNYILLKDQRSEEFPSDRISFWKVNLQKKYLINLPEGYPVRRKFSCKLIFQKDIILLVDLPEGYPSVDRSSRRTSFSK